MMWREMIKGRELLKRCCCKSSPFFYGESKMGVNCEDGGNGPPSATHQVASWQR